MSTNKLRALLSREQVRKNWMMPLNLMLYRLRVGHVSRVSGPAGFQYGLSEEFGLSTLAAMSSESRMVSVQPNPAFGGGEE
jgi:hypothetical protein